MTAGWACALNCGELEQVGFEPVDAFQHRAVHGRVCQAAGQRGSCGVAAWPTGFLPPFSSRHPSRESVQRKRRIWMWRRKPWRGPRTCLGDFRGLVNRSGWPSMTHPMTTAVPPVRSKPTSWMVTVQSCGESVIASAARQSRWRRGALWGRRCGYGRRDCHGASASQ